MKHKTLKSYSCVFFETPCSSRVATNWDKIVAEIFHKTFVFLGHPTGKGVGQTNRDISPTPLDIVLTSSSYSCLGG